LDATNREDEVSKWLAFAPNGVDFGAKFEPSVVKLHGRAAA
jgi:hypothetical protein